MGWWADNLRLASLLATLALVGCLPEEQPPPLLLNLSAPAGLLVIGTSQNPILLLTNANFDVTAWASGSLESIDMSKVDESQRLNFIENVALSAVPLPNFSGPMVLSPLDPTTVLITNRDTLGINNNGPDRLFFASIADPSNLALETIHPGNTDTANGMEIGEGPYGIIAVQQPPVGPGRPARNEVFVACEVDGGISVVNLDQDTDCNTGYPAPCLENALGLPRATDPVYVSAVPPAPLIPGVLFQGPGLDPDFIRDQTYTVQFVGNEGPGPCPLVGTDPTFPEGFWDVTGTSVGLLDHHACVGYEFDDPQITFTITLNTDSAGNPQGAPPANGDTFVFDTFAGQDTVFPSDIFLTGVLDPGASVSGSGVGELIYDPFRQRIYATSTRTNDIYIVDAPSWRFLGAWTVPTNIGGAPNRGMAMSPDGSLLYVLGDSPPALLIIDPTSYDLFLQTQASPIDKVLVENGLVDSIPLDDSPGEMALSQDGRYVFITATNANEVDVIDLLNPTAKRSSPTGRNPFSIRLNALGTRAYITDYFGPAIDVLDTVPTSPTFGTVLTTIANDTYNPD